MNTKQTNANALAEADIPQADAYEKAHRALFAVVMTAGLCSTFAAMNAAASGHAVGDNLFLTSIRIILLGIFALAVAIVPITLAKPLGEADFDQKAQLWFGALAMMALDGFFQMGAIGMYVDSMGRAMPSMTLQVDFKTRPNPIWICMVAALAIVQLAPLLLISGLKGATKSQRDAIQRYQLKLATLAAEAEADIRAAELADKRAAEAERQRRIDLAERRVKSRARKAGETLTPKQFRTRLKTEMAMCGLIEMDDYDAPEGLPERYDNVLAFENIQGRIAKDLMAPRPNFSWPA